MRFFAMIFSNSVWVIRPFSRSFFVRLEMLYDGKSQRTIATIIGKPQSSINYMVKRMEKIIQQHIQREDFSR